MTNPTPEAVSEREAPTDAQIQSTVTAAVRDGALPWSGYQKDEDGIFSIPSLSPVHFGLVRLGAALAGRPAVVGEEPVALPPLPEPWGSTFHVQYSAEDLKAYATSAVHADRIAAPLPSAEQAGAVVAGEPAGGFFEWMTGTKPVAPSKAVSLDPLDRILPDICQILDTVKMEWSKQGAWSEWDQSVRDRISAHMLAGSQQ